MKQQDLNVNTYLEIIKKKISDFDDKKVQVFDDGRDFVVIVVDNCRVFRFPRREDYVKKLPVETKFLELFADKSPVRTPRLSYQKDETNETAYVTYNFISGVRFTKNISHTF